MPIKRLAISCLFAFAVFLSSFGGTLRAAGPGFAAMAGEPGAVEAGFRLPPRSALVPYPSREEALAGGTSSYVIPLEEWQRDSVPEGVRYTARFKVRYAWDNRAVLLRVEELREPTVLDALGERRVCETCEEARLALGGRRASRQQTVCDGVEPGFAQRLELVLQADVTTGDVDAAVGDV